MTFPRLLACIAGCAIVGVHANAQTTAPATSGEQNRATPAELSGPTAPVLSPASAGTPLTLDGGAVPTGISGYYDYQSNGMSPGYIVVSPTNPNHIHTTMMVATDTSSTEAINSSRRVGYAYSSDGGKTWVSNNAIDEIRLGYPYLRLLPDNNAILSTHGDVDGLRTLFYVGQSEGDPNLFQVGGAQRTSSGGRNDVIWSSFVVHPTNPSKLVTIGSVSPTTGTTWAPLQVTTFDIDAGEATPWKAINEDSLIAAVSGGRYVISRSAGGKLGVAYYHYANSTDDFEDVETPGIWLTESTDGGTTWSEPEHLIGLSYTDEYQINDDIDTTYTGPNIDFVYKGEEPHIVTNGSTGGSAGTLYRTQAIYHWSRATGVTRIAVADTTTGIGVQTASRAATQSNVAYVSYPTISLGQTGDYLVVAFQAASQTTTDGSAVVSEGGFNYFRLWGVASRNGGQTWGEPFLIQDFAGGERDSASIEYPSAAEIGQVDENGNFQLDLVYQARRFPGMYAFVATFGDGTTASTGPINETFQYFQRVTVTPQMMGAPASVGGTIGTARIGSIAVRPSHVSATATVEYTLASSGPVSIRLYNSLGSEVLNVVDAAPARAGSYTKLIDLSTLPNGLYRCVLLQNGAPVSTPVVVAR